MEYLCRIADQHKGKSLATQYINSDTNYEWECSEGHRWFAKSYVTRDNWCAVCAGRRNNKKYTIEKLHELAKNNGGECLSTEYKNIWAKYDFKCHKEHTFTSVAANIRGGNWCPKCRLSKGERIITNILKNLHDTPFIHQYKFDDCRHINPLVFDFYLLKHNAVIEFQGRQHYKYDRAGWNTKENLELVKRNDKIKWDYCLKNNIKLIYIQHFMEVKYIESTILYWLCVVN